MFFSAAGAFMRFLSQPCSTGPCFRATFTSRLLPAALFAVASVAAHGQTTTATTLAMTSGGGTVTTVTSGSVVTLTATVIAGSTPVTVGQVNFCDAAVAYCTDIHLLATAQLTSAGTAVYKFRPGVGSHSYKAVFVGTPHGAANNAGSASSVAALTVTGLTPSVTVLQANSNTNNSSPYSLTAIVGGVGSGVTPTGAVSLASGSYSAQQALAAGSASVTIAARTLSAGANTLTASYSGDGTYASASGTITVTVAPLAMAIPAPAAVAPGTSATATATLTAGWRDGSGRTAFAGHSVETQKVAAAAGGRLGCHGVDDQRLRRRQQFLFNSTG
jgi:hypothetical protein